MNYCTIKWTDVANGVGVRISLFVSGCRHGCPGCFNPESWSFQAGEPFTPQMEETLLQKLSAPYIRGLSLLGGEPLDPKNQEAIYHLLQKIRKDLPEKDIWCYSGYVYEDLIGEKIGSHDKKILSLLDILVDGKFIQERHKLSLRFRGSDNQRIIQVPDSLAQEKIVLWPGQEEKQD